MATGLWSSARLIYRGVDNDDEEFLQDLNRDPVSFLNAAPMIPTPRSKKIATEFREWLQKDSVLMAAIICIPPSQEEIAAAAAAAASATNGADGKDDKSKKPKPIPIGTISLHGDEPRMAHHRRSEIGVHLLPEYHGQGYGTEAIRWALRWGFKRANLHRIGIGHFAWNVRAGQLYQRLGFKPEAKKRDFFWHDGEYHDLIELSMLEHEWRELYGKDA